MPLGHNLRWSLIAEHLLWVPSDQFQMVSHIKRETVVYLLRKSCWLKAPSGNQGCGHCDHIVMILITWRCFCFIHVDVLVCLHQDKAISVRVLQHGLSISENCFLLSMIWFLFLYYVQFSSVQPNCQTQSLLEKTYSRNKVEYILRFHISSFINTLYVAFSV